MKLGIIYNGQPGMGDVVARYAEHLTDVTFHSPNVISVLEGEGAADQQAYSVRLHDFLSQVRETGLPLVLAYDPICVEDEEEAATRNEALDDLLKFYHRAYGVNALSVASPTVGRTMKRLLPELQVRCSANMFLGELAQVDQVRDFADMLVLNPDINRDLSALAEIRKGFKGHIRLLANEGCIFRCVNRIHHRNRLSHLGMSAHGPLPCTVEHERDPALLLRSSIIRPEDVKRYEGLADSIQLETREIPTEIAARILDAYSTGAHAGNLSDLVACPGMQAYLNVQAQQAGPTPPAISNDLIPTEYFEQVTTCHNQCNSCTFCDNAAHAALRA